MLLFLFISLYVVVVSVLHLAVCQVGNDVSDQYID